MADYNHPDNLPEDGQPEIHPHLHTPPQAEGRVIPVQGTRLPSAQEDGRLRYLATQPSDQAGATEASPGQAPKPKRWKRWLWAALMPFLLALGGFLVFGLIGENGILRTYSAIAALWLPLTVFRIALYVLLAWVVWPRLMRGYKAQAWANLSARQALLHEQGALDYDAMAALELDAGRIEQARIPSWAVLMFCLVLELAFVQLPYHMIAGRLPL